MPLAWVPYAGRAEAEQRLGGVPGGLELDFYRADGDALPATIGEVAFYVLPYMKGTGVLDKVSAMSRLEVVQTLTAGYEDVLPLLPDGVTLCNAAGLHDTSTAELAIALALASGRRLDQFARDQLSGTWDQRPGRSLADQRVLIVGYGRIGAAIEARLRAFEVASVTRVSRRGRTGPPPVHPFGDLPALLPAADVVFVAAPHTPQTDGLFGPRNLGLLPDGALLVNVARGALVDTTALLAELASGRITAALDVTSPEPLPADHPLWHAPGVLISPHVGGASSAFAPRADRLIAAQLARFAAGQPLANIVRPGQLPGGDGLLGIGRGRGRGAAAPVTLAACTLGPGTAAAAPAGRHGQRRLLPGRVHRHRPGRRPGSVTLADDDAIDAYNATALRTDLARFQFLTSGRFHAGNRDAVAGCRDQPAPSSALRRSK